MKKRFLSLLLVISVLATLMTALPITAIAATSGTCGDNLTWTLDDNGTLTIRGMGEMNDYDYKCAPWYLKREFIRTVDIKNGVTTIGDYAFYNCSSLISVTIPNSVIRIGDRAFYNCASLQSIAIPNSVTSIENGAFKFCDSLQRITIPNSVIKIGNEVFSYCKSLQSVIIGNSVTIIGDSAFSVCDRLTSITIPDSVITIGNYAFEKCGSLTSITIPDSVITIGNYAFEKCGSLTSITIPNSVTTIGASAFSDCSSLEKITIPNSVTSLGGLAFYNCRSLQTINVDEKNLYYCDIDGNLFNKNKTKLIQYAIGKISTSYEIPDSVTEVGRAFSSCSSLQTVKIGRNTTYIGYGAFEYCKNLTNVAMSGSISLIWNNAFSECDNLTDVYYSESETEWLNIDIRYGNYDLTSANIHFNSIPPDTNAINCFAQITYSGTTYDLLAQPINIDKESKAEVSVKVDYKDGTGKEKIYLTQNAENAVILENNVSKSFIPTDVFDADKDIYILIVNEETGETFSERTRLRIVDDTASGELSPDSGVSGLNFKLGNETGFTIPDKVPCFGGAQIKWDFDFIPISVEYDREDNNKINVVFGTSIAKSDGEEDKYFADFDFKEYKKAFKKAASKQGRTLKQLRNDFKMSNAYKMNLFGGRVLGGGTGKPNFEGDVAGYAEMKIIDGKPTFIEGQLCLEAEISYTYQGQLFIWVVPVYYEIGAGIGAGFEGNMINIDPQSFTPEFEAYLTAKITAELGAGVGVAKVATVGVGGEGSLNLKTALHEDYLKAWGEGTANINVKIFCKEVAKSDFLSGDFLIYETGNANGLIPDSAVTLASVEEQDLYSEIDINEVYENESRAYTASQTEWYGDMPAISLMSAEYTNRDTQLLAENVYTESAPMMCNTDGKKVMVMLWDDTDREAANRSMVVYSVYDDETGLWSAPAPVFDDDTADFYPNFKDGYLVWQNSKSPLNDSMTLAEIASLGEICVAKWNGSGFDEPVTLTDNDTVDTQPVVASSDSETVVVWTANTQNDILGLTGSNSVMKATIKDGIAGGPEAIKENLNAVVNLAAENYDSDLYIAYSFDEDNDFRTIDDRDIWIIKNGSEFNLTDNDITDSNPIFKNGVLYYYSGGKIEYCNMSDLSKKTVFDEPKPGLNDSFAVDSNDNGDIAVWWTKAGENSTEVVCVLYKNGGWSDEITISNTGNQAKYPTGVFTENGNMYVAYNNSIWENGEITRSDLYTLEVTPSYDLELTEAVIDEDTMTVYATVKNAGELNVDSYTVTITDNGAVNSQKTINEGLKAGASAEVVIEYNRPENLSKHTIEVGADIADEEFNTDNNIKNITVGNSDVEIVKIENYEKLPVSQAVAVVANSGFSDTGKVTAYLRKDKADGDVLETQTIENLTPGETADITFDYNIAESSNIQWYVTVECENEEITSANDDMYFINNYSETAKDYMHDIVMYNIEGNTLKVNAFVENNTDIDLTAESLLAVYGADGRLKALKTSVVTTPKYDTSSVNFTFDTYGYETSDFIKLFMWDSINNMSPLMPPISKVLEN